LVSARTDPTPHAEPPLPPESRPAFRFHVQHPSGSRGADRSVVQLRTRPEEVTGLSTRGPRATVGLRTTTRLDAHSQPVASRSGSGGVRQTELAHRARSMEEPMFHVQLLRECGPIAPGRAVPRWSRPGPGGQTYRLRDRPMIPWPIGRQGVRPRTTAPGRAPRRPSTRPREEALRGPHNRYIRHPEGPDRGPAGVPMTAPWRLSGRTAALARASCGARLDPPSQGSEGASGTAAGSSPRGAVVVPKLRSALYSPRRCR
jgi:hypothetical protein